METRIDDELNQPDEDRQPPADRQIESVDDKHFTRLERGAPYAVLGLPAAC